VAARLVTIPQAAVFSGPHPFDLAARWSCPPRRVLFVFPAGIRMVKQPLLPLAPFDRLVQRRPQVRLLYVGPVLDPDQGSTFWASSPAGPGPPRGRRAPRSDEIAPRPIRRRAQLLHLRRWDVELGARGAGGWEARAGLGYRWNRSLVEDGVTGFLFRDTTELEAKAEQLAADRALRERLGLAGRDLVERRYPPRREVESYLGVYARLAPVASA